VLLCVIVCCSASQCVAAWCSVLQCVAVCCSVLQCVAVCCSVLQCVAVCCLFLPLFLSLSHFQCSSLILSVSLFVSQYVYLSLSLSPSFCFPNFLSLTHLLCPSPPEPSASPHPLAPNTHPPSHNISMEDNISIARELTHTAHCNKLQQTATDCNTCHNW